MVGTVICQQILDGGLNERFKGTSASSLLTVMVPVSTGALQPFVT